MRYEYKITRELTEKELKSLGEEGWELVTADSSYIFKRPVYNIDVIAFQALLRVAYMLFWTAKALCKPEDGFTRIKSHMDILHDIVDHAVDSGSRQGETACMKVY